VGGISNRYEPGGLAWNGTTPGTLTLHPSHADFTPDHPHISNYAVGERS
jgi:hypothetical protein